MPWSTLVDMELDDEDKLDLAVPEIASKPDYPWGLRISLGDKELGKLGLAADCDVGDMIDMRCFGVVTSVSKNEVNGESCCRVEIQIQKIALDDEMREEG